MFWTLRFCVPLLVDPPSHIEEHLLEHLHPLLFAARSHWVALALFTTFSNASSLVRLLLAMLIYHGSLGPNPWLFLHGHLARVSSTTSNDFDANSLRVTVVDPSTEPAQF